MIKHINARDTCNVLYQVYNTQSHDFDASYSTKIRPLNEGMKEKKLKQNLSKVELGTDSSFLFLVRVRRHLCSDLCFG